MHLQLYYMIRRIKTNFLAADNYHHLITRSVTRMKDNLILKVRCIQVF